MMLIKLISRKRKTANPLLYRCFYCGFILLILMGCSRESLPVRTPSDQELKWSIFRGDAALSGVAGSSLRKLQLRWSFQTKDEIKSSPVIGWGHVYIGSSDNHIYCLRLATGDSLWAFSTGDAVEASPLLLDSTVYIGSLNGSFFALDAFTGAEKWHFKADGGIYGSANWLVSSESSAPQVIFGSYDFNLYNVDAASGKLNWSFATDNFINGSPATDGRALYFGGCDELLHVVSAQGGKQVAAVDAGSYIAGSVALSHGYCYLGHYGDKVICIDPVEKRIVWEYDDNGQAGAFFSSPAVSDDFVVIGSRDRRVHCLQRKTGTKKWTFTTRDDVDSSPVISDGQVVVGSSDGRLYLINLDDGKLLWSYEVGSPIQGSPAVAGGYVVIGAGDGRVYTFGAQE